MGGLVLSLKKDLEEVLYHDLMVDQLENHLVEEQEALLMVAGKEDIAKPLVKELEVAMAKNLVADPEDLEAHLADHRVTVLDKGVKAVKVVRNLKD